MPGTAHPKQDVQAAPEHLAKETRPVNPLDAPKAE